MATRRRWLDRRSFETRETLRRDLAQTLIDLGLENLDLSGVVGPKRQLTQSIGRWVHVRDYRGLAYSSRFRATLTRLAVFEGAAFEPVGLSRPFLPNDPDLIATAKLFSLSL